jgi:hypothetical protein
MLRGLEVVKLRNAELNQLNKPNFSSDIHAKHEKRSLSHWDKPNKLPSPEP